MKICMVMMSFVGAVLLLTGCRSTTTTIYDPGTTAVNIRHDQSVSSEEFRQVAVAAVNSAMTNARFNTFLRKYKKEQNDPDAIPVLKLDKVVNDTDDPDLNVGEMTDMINEALLNAGKVDVTMAEGTGRSKAIAASRDLEDDENFDQKTVARRGTLQAARLVLRPKVTSHLYHQMVISFILLSSPILHTRRLLSFSATIQLSIPMTTTRLSPSVLTKQLRVSAKRTSPPTTTFPFMSRCILS